MTDERELLEAALMGYAMKREAIERKIEQVRVMLTIANSPIVRLAAKQRTTSRLGKRKLTPEGRLRIIAATRNRWAKWKREKARKGGRG